MQRGKWLYALAGASLFAVSAVAQAASVPPAYEQVEWVNGVGAFNNTFTVDVVGTYQATLTDFEFPAAFDVLALAITTTTIMQGNVVGPGQFEFDAVPGVTYFANVFADASGGQFDLGLFGVEVALVPIPAAAVLFGSALVGMVVVGRRRRAEPAPVPA